VFKILDNKDFIPDHGQITASDLQGHVVFKDVCFSYDGENKVLKGVDFEILPGQKLAIVGSTGSGKSTIINILNRFYTLESGQVLIDGIDIHEYKLKSLRSRMAVVLQDVFLFDGTVMDNITLRDGTVPDQKVREAAAVIGADKYIEQLPGGYQFHITERGSNLSVGQRQLISFVRALVSDPDILIMDEATSSIDTETESIIQHAIEKLIEKRTSIIIAHRLSTIRNADKIIVLENGEITEEGTHESLLSTPNSHYKNLYEMQFQQIAV
jgi:ATP-binding cassette subfamily B protein